MDLFARELLLPRPLIVDLHVVQGQTCSDIAGRLGAPFEVVAQQMLDALLLPAIPVVAEADPVEIPLNDKQRDAALHRGAAFLLQAGPGTGKTRTLVARVESLLDEGVDPRRILLLTFSNKAAGEMTERIALKRPKDAAALCIGTFHSFGLDILRRFNDRCSLPADPRLMDRTEAVELLENEFPRLGLAHYRNLYRYRDQAVLCRGNDRLSDVGRELERAGIPVLFLGSLFERPEVKDLVAVLTLLVDRRAMGLIRTACWPEFTMGLEDAVRVFEHLRETNAEPGAWRLGSPAEVTQAGQAALSALNAALAGFDATSQPWNVLATLLLDRTRQAARIASSTSVPEQAQGIAIWQFMNFVRVQPNARGLPIQRLSDRVRRLLRLRDDRDLRQLPAAAQGIDAVRLMTIHGSKGLEFPAVHVAGVNKDSIPGALRSSKCPPPTGMVAGGQDSAEDVARAAHNEEQECLFFVAMSRARNRLTFYGATATASGRARALSPFLDRIGPVNSRPVTPTTVMPPAPDEAIIPVVFSGTPRFSSDAVGLYESCARRFLYTHLLQVGGRRRTSSFMQMHEAIREVYRAVVVQGGAPTGKLGELLSKAFVNHGLHEHGYVEDYRAMATTMLRYFLESREGAVVEAPTALRVSFGDHEVEVTPDEVLVRNGVRTLRRVKTGHASSGDGKDVGAAAFVLASKAAFPDASVEFVYLADAESKTLTLSPKELSNRQDKLGDIFRGIRAGQFKTEASDAICPNCPAFFVCGAVPPGTLSKNF